MSKYKIPLPFLVPIFHTVHTHSILKYTWLTTTIEHVYVHNIDACKLVMHLITIMSLLIDSDSTVSLKITPELEGITHHWYVE